MTLTASPSETLIAAPTLTVNTPSAGLAPTFAIAVGPLYTYQATIAAGEVSGAYTTTVGLTDLVGNASTASGPSFTLDTVVPTVSGLTVTNAAGVVTSLFSDYSGFNVVKVKFNTAKSVDSIAGQPSVTVGGNAASCGIYSPAPPNYTCTYTATGTEGTGPKQVLAMAADEVGNVSSESTSISFDETPISLTTSVSTEQAQIGTQLILSVSTNKALSSVPSVTPITSGGAVGTLGSPMVVFGTGETSWTYVYPTITASPPAAEIFGTFQLNVDASDNVGHSTVGSQVVTADNVPTTISNLQVTGGNNGTFSATAPYNVVTVTFDTPKSLDSTGDGVSAFIEGSPRFVPCLAASIPARRQTTPALIL